MSARCPYRARTTNKTSPKHCRPDALIGRAQQIYHENRSQSKTPGPMIARARSVDARVPTAHFHLSLSLLRRHLFIEMSEENHQTTA